MYLDAMQQIYTNVTKVVVDSKQGSNLMYLPLDKLMQMTGAPLAATAPTDQAGAPSTTPPAAAPSSTPQDLRSRESQRTRDREIR
jgi:membrane protease subunit HflK